MLVKIIELLRFLNRKKIYSPNILKLNMLQLNIEKTKKYIEEFSCLIPFVPTPLKGRFFTFSQ